MKGRGGRDASLWQLVYSLLYGATLNLNAAQCLKIYPKAARSLVFRLEKGKTLFRWSGETLLDTSIEI